MVYEIRKDGKRRGRGKEGQRRARKGVLLEVTVGHDDEICISFLTPNLKGRHRRYSADHLICQVISKPL